MCTLVLLRRPGHSWPLLLAANRDELRSRPSLPPGRHWPDRPHVVAGLDLDAGGSWLGINDDGVVAAVLNRRGSLGREPGKRSRGELVLEALDHAEARVAAEALADLDPAAWRTFNLVVADAISAFWLRHAGTGRIEVTAVPAGLSMLTSGDLDDPSCARIRSHRPRFEAASPPDPEGGTWHSWIDLLGSHDSDTGNPREAMCVHAEGGYGTVSSSVLALPADPARHPVWLYADGPPHAAPFRPVGLVPDT